MTRVGLACLFIATLALSGCKGDKGDPGTPGTQGPVGGVGDVGATGATGATGTFEGGRSVNAIYPSSAFVGRTIDVTISGFNTMWASDPDTALAVDFGPGVTVNDVAVASPTALLANITVAPTAVLGARDVTVSTNDGTLTYGSAFGLESPLEVVGYLGDLAQGGVAFMWVQNRDFTTPFDTAYDSSEDDYPLLGFAATPGVNLTITYATAFDMEIMAFFDVTAAAGTRDLNILSGGPGMEVQFPLPEAFPVTARTPTALVPGTPSTGTVANSFDTFLYVYTPSSADPTRVSFLATASDAEAFPGFMLLPASGAYADMITFIDAYPLVTSATAPYYLIYWDVSGMSAYDYSLRADTDNEATNVDCDNAVALTPPTKVFGQSFTGLADEDWYSVATSSTMEADTLLHVRTTPGDLDTDAYIEVYEGTSCETATLFAVSNHDYHEIMLTPALTGGMNYYLNVWNPWVGGSLYNLEVTFEKEPATGNACDETVAVTLPYDSPSPLLLTATDEDWFSFSTVSADEGKILEVITLGGDEGADTAVALYDDVACASLVKEVDVGDHTYFVSPPLTGGASYKVKIFPGASSGNYLGIFYNVHMELRDSTAGVRVEVEPNDGCWSTDLDETQLVSVPFESAWPFSLSGWLDGDWLKFTVTAADIGKRIHVVTGQTADYPFESDTAVWVAHGDDCGELYEMGYQDNYPVEWDPSSGYHEDFYSSPIYEAGDYYVIVMAGYNYGYYPTWGTDYSIKITLE